MTLPHMKHVVFGVIGVAPINVVRGYDTSVGNQMEGQVKANKMKVVYTSRGRSVQVRRVDVAEHLAINSETPKVIIEMKKEIKQKKGTTRKRSRAFVNSGEYEKMLDEIFMEKGVSECVEYIVLSRERGCTIAEAVDRLEQQVGSLSEMEPLFLKRSNYPENSESEDDMALDFSRQFLDTAAKGLTVISQAARERGVTLDQAVEKLQSQQERLLKKIQARKQQEGTKTPDVIVLKHQDEEEHEQGRVSMEEEKEEILQEDSVEELERQEEEEETKEEEPKIQEKEFHGSVCDKEHDTKLQKQQPSAPRKGGLGAHIPAGRIKVLINSNTQSSVGRRTLIAQEARRVEEILLKQQQQEQQEHECRSS